MMKHKHVDVYLSSAYVIFQYIYSKHTVVIVNIKHNNEVEILIL